MTVRLLVASRNAAKLAELQRVLESEGIAGIEPVSLAEVPEFEEVPEDGATFADNARLKARSGLFATGMPCLADDSGLTVDAMNGMPGVLSARWAGRHGDDTANNSLLLDQLSDVPDERREAAFVSVCALAYIDPAPRPSTATLVERTAEGRWPGRVLRDQRGDGGFGYDPLFLPEGYDRAAAELSPLEKDADSHRGRALRALAPALRALAERG